MIKACIFDLDGTLADTLESMAYVANTIIRKYGLEEQPTDNFRYYCGEGASVLMKRCLLDAGDKKLEHLEEGQQIYRDMFAKNPMYKVEHYDGMPETLKKLKEMGIKIGVCSNKPHLAAVKVIDKMFPQMFEIVLGQNEEIPRKPAPDGVWKIAKFLEVKSEECAYVGDTKTDMQTGKAAGMLTIGVLWGFRDKEELLQNGADVIIEKPEKLLKICEEWQND